VKAGVIFLVTSGEYSDYGIRATLLALQDFSWDDEAQDFERRRQASDTYIDSGMVIDHIIARGLARHVYLPEIDLGSYGALNPGAEASVTKGSTPLRGWTERCIDHDDCVASPVLGAACAVDRP